MTKIFLSGLNGKMGRAIQELCGVSAEFEITGGFDLAPDPCYPVFDNYQKVNVPFDVIIDFSRPENLGNVIGLSHASGRPAVLATTGYSNYELDKIKLASEKNALFISGNMSLGINLLSALIKKASAVLWDGFDIEIIEKHHNQKVDAPSGTAKMLAAAVSEGARVRPDYVYGREGKNAKRKGSEIGIHAIRGGTIVGEHEVIFAGTDEIITLSHTALSRNILAAGALKAAAFLVDKPAGLYNMDDLLK